MTNKYEIIFISPHLDDAILSCGGLIAKFSKEKKKILIVTVFTEGINKKRKNEDNEVCKALNVDYIHLGLTDVINRKNDLSWEKIKDKLIKRIEIQKNGVLYFPLGIGGHMDHLLVRQVGVSFKKNRVYFWEDYPYKMYNSAQIELLKLREHFLLNIVENIEDFLDTKKRLIGLYKSQTKVIFGSKPIFLSSFEKYYIKKDGDLNDGILYLTDELEGGAKIANDYILGEITKQTDLEKFEILEQVYRLDNSKLSGTKKWFWSVWSYELLLKKLNYLNLTVLTTSPNALMAAWWLKKRGFIKNIKFILYSNGDRSYFSRSLLASKNGLSFIYYGIYCFWYRFMEKISVVSVDKIIVASKFYKNLLIKKYNLKNINIIKVITHGVDQKIFFDDKKVRKAKSRVVAYVGRMDPQKGILKLIKTIDLLSIDNVYLWLILLPFEKDKYSELIWKMIKNNSKIKIFQFHSRIELVKIYRKIDLVILPSENENSPLVMLESLASGCGFMGSNTGSMSEIIKRYDKTMLIESVDEKLMAKKIERYFNYSQKKKEQLQKKIKKIMNLHSWTKTARLILMTIKDEN